MFKIWCLVVVVVLIENCRSARILGMFPTPAMSHQLVFKALTQELAKKGHQITFVSSLSIADNKQMDNYTEINIKHIGEEIRKELQKVELNKAINLYGLFKNTIKTAFDFVNTVLQSKEVQNMISYNSFDLILVEDCLKSSLILSHLFKAPVILVSSFGGSFDTFETVGAVTHPILHPLAIRKRFQDLSTWEKISEVFAEYHLQKTYNELIMEQNEINKQLYGPNTPTIDDLKKNVQMIFLNTHPIWDSNRPVPPNVIYLGGLHRKPANELPKVLKSSLDSSIRGAIYVSFGTIVDFSMFTQNHLQILINVFSKLPYDIYWRWNNDTLPGKPENVKISKWFPQADVLRHPNIKLFITQGGLQSTDEAIDAAVPLIGIPLLWDQWFNADKYIQLKIGKKLDLGTLTEDELRNAIESVINDKKYYNNIAKLRSLMLDTPQSSLERAVWWIEYVLRHGGEHLRAPEANMSWSDYYEVKIILYLLFIIISMVVLVLIAFNRIFGFIINKYNLNKIKTH